MICPKLLCVAVAFPTVLGAVLETGAHDANVQIAQRQAMPRPGELVDFQVSSPVLVPNGTRNQYGCVYTKTLMEHTFGNSYNAPFVGTYSPPPCDFNRVVMNLTVTSKGRQFDRLALMYLSDTEVFRTSTAEPTSNGIIWTYLKEMQQYNALWKRPQKIIFDLGNLQNDVYTGAFETTLTATFFTVPDSPVTADQILPISSRSSGGNTGSVFQVPGQNASVSYTLPKDVNRAVVSLSACGQMNEEFWYSNAPNSAVNTFNDTTGPLLGGGTFREVQLLIDGQLSGVSWPFPVIFTGGIVPGFWRPIVGIDAFDLRQHEIDVTPWLGYLLDGKAHTFEIRVASVNDDGHGHTSLANTPTQYWLVSGSIFLFRDPSGKATTGTRPRVDTPQISISTQISTTKTSNGTNQTLTYTTDAKRTISISSTLKTGNGSQIPVSWVQKLSYTNYNKFTSFGQVQLTKQMTSGSDASASSGNSFSNSYTYPLTVNSSYMYSNGGADLFLGGQLTRGKQLLTLGNPVFPSGLQTFNTSKYSSQQSGFAFAGDAEQQAVPASDVGSLDGRSFEGTSLNTTQVGSAQYKSSSSGTSSTSYSFGTTEQWYDFRGVGKNGGGVNQELYSRHVKAVNASVVEDEQTLLGRTFNQPRASSAGAEALVMQGAGEGGVRQFLGRGPGKPVQSHAAGST